MGSSSSRPKQGVLMVGMDGPCKSSILERLSRGEIVQSVPTIGFHVQTAEQLSCADMAIVTWNFSGSNGLRPLWRHYYKHVNALILVYSSHDGGYGWHILRRELEVTLNEFELRGLPLLIFVDRRAPDDACAARPEFDARGWQHVTRAQGDLMPAKSHWAKLADGGYYDWPNPIGPLVPVTVELIEDFFDLRKPITVDWSCQGVGAFLLGTHSRAGADSVLQRLRGNSHLLERIWDFVWPLQRVEIRIVCTDRLWRVQDCCALTGRGLQQGLDWLQAVLAESGAPGRWFEAQKPS